MTQCYIPQGYKSALDVRETETAIKFVKDTFERTFSKAMQLCAFPRRCLSRAIPA